MVLLTASRSLLALWIEGVYHCTDPVPAEPEWGIALRVSQEAEAMDHAPNSTAGSANGNRKKGPRGEGPGQGSVGETTNAKDTAADAEREKVSTPPLLVPLQSGDAYFLLDDFK